MLLRRALIFALVLSVTFETGCSVYMAATKPRLRDTDIIRLGAPRAVVVSELGAPNSSRRTSEGKLEDTWTFRQGESMWWKVPRMLFNSGADVFTIGLWEIVATPAELLLNKKEKTYVLTFDEKERVASISGTDFQGGAVALETTAPPNAGQAAIPSKAAAVAAAAADPPSTRTEGRLRELQDLLDQRLITRDQYEQKKATILREL